MRSARVLGVLLALCAVLSGRCPGIPFLRYLPLRLSDGAGRRAGRQADARAQRRQARHHRAGLRRSRVRRTTRRPGSRRPARHGAGQSRRLEQPRPVDRGPHSSLSLQVEGTRQARPRRPDRRGDPRQPGKPRPDRAVLLRWRAATLLQRQASDTDAGRPQGIEACACSSPTSGRASSAALGAEPVVAPADRVYLKLQSGVIDAAEQQLAVVRVVAPLSGRSLFQPDRAFDGPGGPGLLQACLGYAVGR